MNKTSGINHFLNLSQYRGNLTAFYSFDSGDQYIPSVSGGASGFSGYVYGDTGSFWSKVGSGLFSGNSIGISNTGISSPSFTTIFSFEIKNSGEQKLINNINDYSGYEIGLNSAHKIYFKSKLNGYDVYSTANINTFGKNVLYVGYTKNNLEIGLYNTNSKKIETENFSKNFGVTKNYEEYIIGSGLNGYADLFLHFNTYINKSNIEKILSGMFYYPTGGGLSVQTICSDVVTGYADIPFIVTGIIGYSGAVTEDSGLEDFSGLFPTDSTSVVITGIVNSGFVKSGITQTICQSFSGSGFSLLTENTGYRATFGSNKVFLTNYVDEFDTIQIYKDAINNDIYNKSLSQNGSGFYSQQPLSSGSDLITYNGQAILGDSLTWRSNNIFSTGISFGDLAIFDSKSGEKKYFSNTGLIPIHYSGQQVFINGQNLISGYFRAIGDQIFLTGGFEDISGLVSERPILLASVTGSGESWTGELIPKRNNLVYLNGIRLLENVEYKEASVYDLLISNDYNPYNNLTVYGQDGDYWE